MSIEIPHYGLKAYALFFSKYGIKGRFFQSELDWIVSNSMKKKIFSLLLHRCWIRKNSDRSYSCLEPSHVITGLLELRVPSTIQCAKKKYAFTQFSAVEIWSDYSYVQRSMEKSPYFIKVLQKDLTYWKQFFNQHHIPNYIKSGTTIGEFIILIPVSHIQSEKKNEFFVEPLQKTITYAKNYDIYSYPLQYMKKKYGVSV